MMPWQMFSQLIAYLREMAIAGESGHAVLRMRPGASKGITCPQAGFLYTEGVQPERNGIVRTGVIHHAPVPVEPR